MATLETGEIQIAEEIPTTDVERLKGDPKYQVINHTYPGGPAQLQMNTEKAPLDELAVRQALEYAINQDQLVKVLFQGVYTAAKAPTSPGTLGYDESLTKTYSFDPSKSQQLLDQAGWQPGSDGIRTKNGQALEISNNAISETPITGQAAEFIQAQLRDVGVRLTIQQLDTGAWNAAVAAGSQMTVIGWRGSSDPDFMRPIFHSSFIGKSPLQRSHFKDDKLDQLLTDGTKEQDPTKRAAIYVEAQKIILDQALIVPLWDRYNFVGARATVRGLTFDPRGYPRLYDVWMAKG
jgi:peptide/nickel transport system substrate-binding protein